MLSVPFYPSVKFLDLGNIVSFSSFYLISLIFFKIKRKIRENVL